MSTATASRTSSPAPGRAAARTSACFSGTDLSELASFYAFDPAFPGRRVPSRRATSTATGAPTSSPAPARAAARTCACSAARTCSELASFYAYDPAFPGGVSVAAGDVNGDGRADIVTGAGAGRRPARAGVQRRST